MAAPEFLPLGCFRIPSAWVLPNSFRLGAPEFLPLGCSRIPAALRHFSHTIDRDPSIHVGFRPIAKKTPRVLHSKMHHFLETSSNCEAVIQYALLRGAKLSLSKGGCAKNSSGFKQQNTSFRSKLFKLRGCHTICPPKGGRN